MKNKIPNDRGAKPGILLPAATKAKVVRQVLVKGKRFIQVPASQEDGGLPPVLNNPSSLLSAGQGFHRGGEWKTGQRDQERPVGNPSLLGVKQRDRPEGMLLRKVSSPILALFL